MTIAAFASLGFLIGNLMGLSAESTVGVVLPLLFAFGGGSAVAFLHKLSPDEQRGASAAVLALSVACLVGAYTGIAVSEFQLLTPASVAPQRVSVEERKLFREIVLEPARIIDQRVRNGEITPERGYDELLALVSEGDAP